MSYTNPKYIQLADPNAAVEAYEKGADKWLAFFEKKKKEEQEIKNKAVASNARLQKSQNLGQIAEQYGSSMAMAYRNYIDDTLVKDDVFASMNEADQQKVIDDLNINVRSKLPITNNLMALDPENIDTNILRENPAFSDFVNNKTNGSAVFHVDKNGPGIKYKDESGNEKIFYTKDVNYDEALFDINGSINKLNEGVVNVAKDLDRAHRGIDKKEGINSAIKQAGIEYFNNLSKSEKIVYYNKMAEEGVIESSTYGIFPDDATPAEIAELQKVQDLRLIDYVTSEIQERSDVYNQFKYEEQKPPTQPGITSAQQKELDRNSLINDGITSLNNLNIQIKSVKGTSSVDLLDPTFTNDLAASDFTVTGQTEDGGIYVLNNKTNEQKLIRQTGNLTPTMVKKILFSTYKPTASEMSSVFQPEKAKPIIFTGDN